MPIWIDLCLARGLRAVSGRAVIPFKQLSSSTQRLQFHIYSVDEDSAEGQPFSIVVSILNPLMPVSLDLVAINDDQRLRWEPEFEKLLRAVEADRLLALAELPDRPVRQSALRFATRIGLGSAEAELLCVLALLRTEEALQETFADTQDGEWFEHLGDLLAASHAAVEKALGRDSALFALNLAPKTLFSQQELEKFPLGLVLDCLVRAAEGGRDPFVHLLAQVGADRQSADACGELPATVNPIVALLREAHASHREGVNVLLLGVPGTRKAPLLGLIAKLVDAKAFELPLADEFGNARNSYSRLDSMPLCQQAVCAQEHPLLIFDKAEDLFPPPHSIWLTRSKQERRDWFNRMLKTNPVPTIWIARNPEHINPTFLRCFDLLVDVQP